MTEHLPVLSVLVYLAGSLLIPIIGRLRAWIPYAVAAGSAGIVVALNLAGFRQVLESGGIRYAVGGWAPPVGIELVLDPLAAFFVLMTAGIALIVLLHSRRPIAEELPEKGISYYSAALLMLAGFSGIVLAGDLFNLYVFLEISALSGYALLGAGSPRAAVATYRYLILGTIGASFYLLGIGFIFSGTGTLNMADLSAILAVAGTGPLIIIGLIFIVTGIGLKMALFPLHLWLPDVYGSAVSSSAALIAPIGTKVAAYVLIRVLFYVMDPDWLRGEFAVPALIGWMGAAGIIWGSIMAIAQTDLRRMLAYSSVAQIGYIALGIGLGNAYGFIGAVLHSLNHACMKSCLFLVSSNLRSAGRTQSIDDLDDSLQHAMPWTAASFTVAALSMIGLPPLAGFFSKWYLLLGSWAQANWAFVAVIIASSLLNAVYFFRVIERLYLPRERSGRRTATAEPAAPSGGAMLRSERRLTLVVPVAVLGLSLILLGLANVAIVRGVIEPMLPSGF